MWIKTHYVCLNYLNAKEFNTNLELFGESALWILIKCLYSSIDSVLNNSSLSWNFKPAFHWDSNRFYSYILFLSCLIWFKNLEMLFIFLEFDGLSSNYRLKITSIDCHLQICAQFLIVLWETVHSMSKVTFSCHYIVIKYILVLDLVSIVITILMITLYVF